MRVAISVAAVLVSVTALAVLGIRAAERAPFSGPIDLQLVNDSIWAHCELAISVTQDGRGSAATDCRSDEGKPTTHAKESVTPQEVEGLRQLLRQANLFEGQSWGYDDRGIDIPLVTLTVSVDSKVTTLVCVRNASFDSGARKVLLSWLNDRMRQQVRRATQPRPPPTPIPRKLQPR
jgi:hypothetical protein